jgi:oligopeptide transport system permease protein
MTQAGAMPSSVPEAVELGVRALQQPDHLWRRLLSSGRFVAGALVLMVILGSCLASLPWTAKENLGTDEDGYPIANPYYYDGQNLHFSFTAPARDSLVHWFGTDQLGRSILMRSLFGGTISLAVGTAAAAISVVLGVVCGLVAGYRGGWVDAWLMRSVDVMYSLPYILLIVLFKVALEDPLGRWFSSGWWVNGLACVLALVAACAIFGFAVSANRELRTRVRLVVGLVVCVGLFYLLGRARPLGRGLEEPGRASNLVVLFLAIGLVSWLPMARVVRGQVLSLRVQPFIDAARATGLPEWRIFLYHLLPNLAGPIIVYATLTVPQAILQESFLSFLGIGVQAPMSSWGSLAADGLTPGLSPIHSRWWTLLFPCTLLCLTLLSLNFLGDGLRDLIDPKREAAKL